MDDSLLVVNSLGIRYRGAEAFSVRHLDLTVHRGESVLITGSNGSGKSTLLRSILRLHPSGSLNETEGSITVLTDRPIGYVHQRPSTQVLTFSVREELATPLSFRAVSRNRRLEVVDELVNTYDLDALVDRDPHHLSSGQLQFVVTLVNFTMGCDLLILDEPFALLDPFNTKALTLGLLELRRKGVSLVIASHHAPSSGLVDRRYELHRGKLIEGILDTWEESEDHSFPSLIGVHHNFYCVLGYNKPAIRIPSFSLPVTGIVLVTGSNGSGKTLLLMSLLGALRPLKGDLPGARSPVIFVPQDSATFYWRSSVGEELEDYGVLSTAYTDQFLLRSPFTLSPGEQKRVNLEIAFRGSFHTILMDEPSYSLDNEGISVLVDDLIEHSKSKLVVLSTNDYRLLDKLRGIESDIYHIDLDTCGVIVDG